MIPAQQLPASAAVIIFSRARTGEAQ